MDLLKRSLLLLVSITLSVIIVRAQTNITWQVLSNTKITGTTLSQINTSSVGYAHSQNFLFGYNGNNQYEGKVTYIIPNEAEAKSIGFTIYGSSDPQVGFIDYGFRILPNNRFGIRIITVFYPGGTMNFNYAANDQISIERTGNKIIYKKGTTVLHELVINHLPGLVVTAELTSTGSTFTGVQVDFTRTVPAFNPTLNQNDKSIDFGSSTSDFEWADGDTGPTVDKGAQGVFPVVITDNNDNRIDRVYSIGAYTSWTNLYQSTAGATSLSVAGAYAAGTAKSNVTYTHSQNQWVEYLVNYQSDPKAVGFMDATATFTTYTNINAGFYLNKSTEPSVQIIDNGAIVKKLVCRQYDVLKIARVLGVYRWYINGVEVYSRNSGTYSYRVCGWVAKTATLLNVHQGTVVPETAYLFPTYSETTDNGEVGINISSFSGLASPFHHFISDYKVYPMSTVFADINADFGGTLNEATFMAGNDSQTQLTFDELDMGTYTVSSFDNYGRRVFGSHQTVLGDFTLQNASGITVSNGLITGSSTSSYGTLNLQMHDREIPESYIELSVEALTALQGFGFGNDNTVIDGYDDLMLGFYLVNDQLYLIDEGVLSTDYFIVEPGMKLKMTINGGTVNYTLNDRPIGSASFTRLDFMTFGVIGYLNSKIRTLGGLSKNPVKNISYSITANDCDAFLADLQLNLPSTFGARTMTYSVNLKDAANNTIGSTNQTSFTGLPIGIYTLTGTATSSLTSYPSSTYVVSIKVYVGVKYTPQASEHVNEGTLGNDVLGAATISLPSTDGESVGSNILPNATDGWISFRPVLSFNGANNFNSILLSASPQLNATTSQADDIYVRFSTRYNYFYYNSPSSMSFVQMNYFMTQQPLTVRRQGTTAHIDNGQSSLQLATGYTSEKCRPSFTIKKQSTGFKGVVTSMRCPEYGNIFGHLKYEMDGYYHVMKKGKLKFLFDQEYGDADLTFNIYNYRDELVKTQANYPVVATTNGQNFITIELTNAAGCLGRGFFYIEVINSKKEHMYLRFFNDYSTIYCNDFVAPADPNAENE